MSWQAIIGESRPLGDRQETSVVFTDGTRKFVRSFVNDGSLAALKPSLVSAAQQTDTFETTKAKNELVPGTVIDLTPPVPVVVTPPADPPPPTATELAQSAFRAAIQTYRMIKAGVEVGVKTTKQLDDARAIVVAQYQDGFEFMLGLL